MTKPFDILWTHATLATMSGDKGYGLIADAAVGITGQKITWVGPMAELDETRAAKARESVDCGSALVTPGLIDCHTHLVYGGSRANEFEQRLNGACYETIARQGGGIRSTVTATRKATKKQLYDQAAVRLDALLAEGVTTVEIKSGYGLRTKDECKMLRVAKQLENRGVAVSPTFLGAHALPPEYADNADGYIDYVCHHSLPAVAGAGLADSVDAFCEGIGFSTEQVARVFVAATGLGLKLRLHAEQLSNLGGARMAAECGALSVDHLEYLQPEDIPELARRGTTAVLLPGAFYCLRETQLPPIDALRAHRIPMALATDSNPGTSPVTSLLLMLSMGCTFFRMTPAEALRGVTINAARALGRADRVGSIEVGKRADLVRWNLQDPAELSYRVGNNPCHSVLFGGKAR